MRNYTLGCLLGMTILAAGCGGGATVPVRGRVLLDDAPLEGATVTLVPIDRGRPAAGLTDAGGVFRLTTFEPYDGAMPGTYKIVVTKTDALPPPADGEYGDAQRIRKQGKGVKAGRTGRKALVPAIYADAAKSPLRVAVPTDGEVVLRLESKAK